MIGWIFNKNDTPAAEPAAANVAATAAADRAASADALAAAQRDWHLKLQAALGDDTALLTLALAGAPLDVKVAAVGALASEAALKLAEREFRDHDRRVHRLAKQRHGALVARRETFEKAARLIDAARALFGEPLLAVNRLVELDRAWQSLDATALDAAQRVEFEAMLAQLSTLTRERADEALTRKRWSAQAQQALAGLQAACLEAAAGTQGRGGLAAASAAARQAIDGAPQGDADAAQCAGLAGALQTAAQLDERLGALEQLLQAPAAAEPAPPTDVAAAGETGNVVPPHDALLRWQQFEPLADARLAELLDQRVEQWQRALDEARQARRAQRRDEAKARQHVARNERIETLAGALQRAEAALGEGHLADTHKHLVEIDELLHGGASAGALRARIDALQAGYAQLKGWQHWGGGRARDELVLQAEALAAATANPGDARAVKLTTRQQAEVIEDMRARWKELDRLGGATSRSLWQRFETALKAAYQPVAAQVALQRAAREQNLQARQQLIAALDAVTLPAADGGDVAPDWRMLAGALDHFRTEWRKLGPIEHTVPHKSRDKLVERMNAAVARLESPLQEARHAARGGRERLIARAGALGAEALAGGQGGRELVDRVRQLQTDWQQQARALPLARGDENALWAEFKTAIDAIFSARDAAFNARDAEFRAHGAERLALIERLEALAADTAPAELKRTLAEVDAAWLRAGPAPRSDAAALDARFRRSRDVVVQTLGSSAQRSWHATCDALAAKLVLCESLEPGADQADDRVALAQRWSQLPALPAPWEQALAARAGLPGVAAAGTQSGLSTDELLLQAEAAWGLQSPAAFDAARRLLKLQAMKAALEGRRAATAAPLSPESLLAVLLGRAGLDALQRQRLGAVVAAVRRRGPGDALAAKPAAAAGGAGAGRRTG